MFGVLVPAAEYGDLHTLRTGLKPSTTLSVSSIQDGPQPKLHFNFTDTVAGVKLSGEIRLQDICEISEEQKGSDNEK